MRDPTRHGAVAAVGEVTGSYALSRMLAGMERDGVGRRVLRDRPIVDGTTAASAAAAALLGSTNAATTTTTTTTTTFGGAYAAFLAEHAFDPEHRAAVRYVSDPDLAYVMTRYRQCHDYWHVLTGLPPTVLGELGLKLLELMQTGLPLAALSVMSSSASIAGGGGDGWPRMMSEREREVLWGAYLPWAVRTNGNMREHALMCVYYEEEFGTDLIALRDRMGIEVAPIVEL
jgi:ubiquinone biosynthesis protein COQ4